MAQTYNAWRGSGPSRSPKEYYSRKERGPGKNDRKPWIVTDVESQKAQLRMMLEYAAESNRGKIVN